MLIETWRLGKFITTRQRMFIAKRWAMETRPLSSWYAFRYSGLEAMRPGLKGERVEREAVAVSAWLGRDVVNLLEEIAKPVGYRCPDCVIVHPGAFMAVLKRECATSLKAGMKQNKVTGLLSHHDWGTCVKCLDKKWPDWRTTWESPDRDGPRGVTTLAGDEPAHNPFIETAYKGQRFLCAVCKRKVR